MYLLKQQAQNLIRVNGIEFTFHHVSIKTKTQISRLWKFSHSHSTMYLLKHDFKLSKLRKINDSHSTMYLLKQVR